MSQITTYNEIKQEVTDRLKELSQSDYPEDLLREWADSIVPIFYHDILEEWTQLPMEEIDEWKQYGMDEYFYEGGIFKLMQIDLLLYYERRFVEAWEAVKEEKELAEERVENA
jgi:hypothetical protein